jgi:hypothetical protein
MKDIAKALATAQRNMGKALKQANNPAFRSKYADLGAVMDACLPALNEAGIAVIQPLVESEFGRGVKTVFIHESGDTLDTVVPLIVGKNDMQGLGSAITYARRYGLMTLAGIAPEDDDGNAAAASVKHNPATEGLADAWRDSVLDKLPANATKAEKAEAFADAICDEFKGKKQKALDNAWQRRAEVIESLERRYPEYHARVVHAYEQQQELNSMETAAE